ncbi:hypothetical protein [Massilia sp. AB1]|uniref:hypothetical protein n=1 Tax=Massilia sp. AB1 TaxID=2823371 RepID=UPI001E409F4A
MIDVVLDRRGQLVDRLRRLLQARGLGGGARGQVAAAARHRIRGGGNQLHVARHLVGAGVHGLQGVLQGGRAGADRRRFALQSQREEQGVVPEREGDRQRQQASEHKEEQPVGAERVLLRRETGNLFHSGLVRVTVGWKILIQHYWLSHGIIFFMTRRPCRGVCKRRRRGFSDAFLSGIKTVKKFPT